MSEAEARFDARRRAFGRWLGPILATAILLAPLELPNDAHRLSAICVLVVIWWVTEAIPLAVTAVHPQRQKVPEERSARSQRRLRGRDRRTADQAHRGRCPADPPRPWGRMGSAWGARD